MRRRQKEAIDAAVFALETPPGGIPEQGLRTPVIAAPGSGKTLIAYEAARRLEPRGRVLVLVPTLNLLTQTVAKWRQYGMRGNAVAVCSLDRDPEVRAYLAEELDVRCTTNPLRLALWAGTGPVTIFATYASLVGNPGRRSADEDEEDVEASRSGQSRVCWSGRWPGRSGSSWTGSAWPSWTRPTAPQVWRPSRGQSSTTTPASRPTGACT
ncbi:DEAD/DEAH box helicase family protein [Streptomyces sp. 3N207]|uniref:DEAD/DEAH box helicase family protein n=1 Tax=Streptomyces sp. 3N207 TaxID=3457417 RepID=UPI003FD3B31F